MFGMFIRNSKGHKIICNSNGQPTLANLMEPAHGKGSAGRAIHRTTSDLNPQRSRYLFEIMGGSADKKTGTTQSRGALFRSMCAPADSPTVSRAQFLYKILGESVGFGQPKFVESQVPLIQVDKVVGTRVHGPIIEDVVIHTYEPDPHANKIIHSRHLLEIFAGRAKRE